MSYKAFKERIHFDNCKKCGCTYFECNNCNNNEFYRHVDDKDQMKENMKIIRKKGVKID